MSDEEKMAALRELGNKYKSGEIDENGYMSGCSKLFSAPVNKVDELTHTTQDERDNATLRIINAIKEGL